MFRILSLGFSLLVAANLVHGQNNITGETIERDRATRSSKENRDLSVIAPTISLEQIDRAVLNRLMQEILNNASATKTQLGVNDDQLQDIYVTIANAHGFINDNDMANVEAMCDSWENSNLEGEAKITEALAAYSRRAQFTVDFIAKYYGVVVFRIRSSLTPASAAMFDAYMDDRRRRMANAGATVAGSIVENSRSGIDSIRFHCRAD